ncbi:MAG: hypothetical protein R6V54_14075 [Desulfobacteraceae bacterium]
MDKDLASAVMLERCSCYDRALEAAKRVLTKETSDSDNSFFARKIVKNLGEEFLKQRFMDRAMECYGLLTDYAPDGNDCPESDETAAFDGLGPNSVEIRTVISSDVADILKTIEAGECARASTTEALLREAVYLLILKYAADAQVRQQLFNKLEKVIRNDHKR